MLVSLRLRKAEGWPYADTRYAVRPTIQGQVQQTVLSHPAAYLDNGVACLWCPRTVLIGFVDRRVRVGMHIMV